MQNKAYERPTISVFFFRRVTATCEMMRKIENCKPDLRKNPNLHGTSQVAINQPGTENTICHTHEVSVTDALHSDQKELGGEWRLRLTFIFYRTGPLIVEFTLQCGLWLTS